MKAITVKYHGATNTKPAKFVASAEGVKGVSVSAHTSKVEHLQIDSVADYAAIELCKRYGWTSHALIRGGLNGKGDLVYVFDAPECRVEVCK